MSNTIVTTEAHERSRPLREFAAGVFAARRTGYIVLVAALCLFAAGLFVSTGLLISGAMLILLAAMRLHYVATTDRARRTHRYLRCRCDLVSDPDPTAAYSPRQHAAG